MRSEQLESRQVNAADTFIGIFDRGTWSLSDNLTQPIYFGLPGDQPVMGIGLAAEQDSRHFIVKVHGYSI